jgi:hypothetical protein
MNDIIITGCLDCPFCPEFQLIVGADERGPRYAVFSQTPCRITTGMLNSRYVSSMEEVKALHPIPERCPVRKGVTVRQLQIPDEDGGL